MNKDTTNLENSNPRVPQEILHSIVSWVVAYYLDSIFAEDLPLDYVNGQLGTAPRSTFSNDSSRTDSDESGVASTSSSEPFNPVLSLLQAGIQTRAPTLCVLSEALGIVVNWNGINFNTIDVDPWARIQDVRHFCDSYIISESAQPSLDAWDGQTEHSNVSEEDSRAARLEQIAPSPFLRAYVWLAATKYRLESTRRAVKAANSLGESSHRNFSHLIRQTHELPGITSDGNYPLRAIVLKRVKFRQWQVASFMVLDATLPAIARAMGHFRRLDESLEKEKSAETSVDQDRSPTMNEDYQEEYTRISTQLSATLQNLEKIVHCFGPTYLSSERSWEPIIESMANVSGHHPPTVIDSVAFKDCQDCALAITEAYLGYIHETYANNVES